MAEQSQIGRNTISTDNTGAGTALVPADNEACVECRSRKRKCIRSESDIASCNRCISNGISCIYSRAKPGRKRKRPWSASHHGASIMLSGEPGPGSSAVVPEIISPPVHADNSMQRNATTGNSSHQQPIYLDFTPNPNAQINAQAAEEPGSSTQARLPYLASEGFSLRGVLNEAFRHSQNRDRNHDISPVAAGQSPWDGPEPDRSLAGSLAPPGDATRRHRFQMPRMDLYSIGAISEEDVKDILQFFFSFMNPLIALLDEQLHGFPQVLDRSNLLFSVILAVSSRICRPEIYSRAASIVSNLLSLAFEQNSSNIEIVQALSIMVFWRNVEDDSGWRRTGYAIRMAYELGLHHIRRTSLPTGLGDCREILNRERTWIQLCCADINFSLQCSLPQMIANDGLTDLGWWFRDHNESPCESEAVLQPSLLLLRIARSHADLIRLQTRGAELGVLLDQVETQHTQWQLDWIDPHIPSIMPITSAQKAVITLASRHLTFKINEFRLELVESDYEIHFAKCQDAVFGVINAFLQLDQLGILPYSQDMVFIGVVSCVIWLWNRMRNTSRIKRDIVYARVLEVMHAVDGIKRGATDIGARTSRLLSLVCQATEPSSPSVLPTRPEGNEASAAMPEPFGLPRPQDHPQNTELELNAFMQTHLITQDLEFWSTWFET